VVAMAMAVAVKMPYSLKPTKNKITGSKSKKNFMRLSAIKLMYLRSQYFAMICT
jgi:hypothetical protein